MMSLTAAESLSVFLIGGSGYCLLEGAFRGWTHWCMFFCGGLCFLLLYVLSNFSKLKYVKIWVLGTVIITTVEYLFGLYFNLHLGWDIWDYSGYRIQLLGQISLLFSFCWFLLCIPGVFICSKLREKLARQ